MALSVFIDKDKKPTETDLKEVLGRKFTLWKQIVEFVYKQYPNAVEEWNYSGIKYGWNFKLKDKKRAIIYLIPCDKYFKIGLVFGEKATNAARSSELSKEILEIIESATVYAEGRGFRIDVPNSKSLIDIKKLIVIKIEN